MICECCDEAEAVHWMEWGEWLCSECMAQANEEDADSYMRTAPERE